MSERNDSVSPEKLSELMVLGMQEKKASDIVVLDLRKVKNAVADFFIICSGNSDRQVDSISESIEEYVYKNIKENPWHAEGKTNKEWILLDYIDVVAHIFQHESREFYALESLWGDALTTMVQEAEI